MKKRLIKILVCLLVAGSCFVVLSAFASNRDEPVCAGACNAESMSCDKDECPKAQTACNREDMPCGKMQGSCGKMQGSCGRNCK